MADKKISALTGATTPLAGTEVLPIVQGGSTVKVSIANVTAGRAVSTGALSVATADITLDNAYALKGKLVAGTAVAMIKRNSADEVTIDEDGYGAKIGFGGRYNFAGGGDFTVGVGNIVIGTVAKGIDFSANANAPGMTSEVLNDYEEGVISIGATCDSGTITLSTNTLYYTKVGRMIHVTGKIVVDSVSSPTGNVYFGLPIVAGVSSAVTLYMSNTNTIAGKIPVGVINAGQTIFYVQTLDQVTGIIGGAASIFKAGTEFTFSASYI